MDEFFKFSRTHFLIGMGFILLLLHINIYQKKLVDLDEVVYRHLSQTMTWSLENYNTIKLFKPGKYPMECYKSPVFHHPPLYPYLIKIFKTVFKLNYIVAAKTINLIILFFSIVFLFLFCEKIFGQLTALLSSLTLLLCPVFLLETNLIHADILQFLFVMAGLFFFNEFDEKNKNKFLIFSGLFFALAMLVKYTSPVYYVFPFLLAVKLFLTRKGISKSILLLSLSSLGFIWWIYILFRFHSLIPGEFVADGPQMLVRPAEYLNQINNRKWYNVWLQFTVIYPMFLLVYIPFLFYIGQKTFKCLKTKNFPSSKIQYLFILNFCSISAAVAFNFANAIANSFWILRHNAVVFPFVYISSSWAIIQIYRNSNQQIRAWLIHIFVLSMLLFLFTSWLIIRYQTLIIESPVNLLFP